jgi:hypothetical protein
MHDVMQKFRLTVMQKCFVIFPGKTKKLYLNGATNIENERWGHFLFN